MAWGDTKCVPPWEILFTSITTKPAIREYRARLLNIKCAAVPERFCEGVCVGCRIRMDSVRMRRPAELRRGCALKSMRGERKMEAQTEAVRRMMPNWAIIAVPVKRKLVNRWVEGRGKGERYR